MLTSNGLTLLLDAFANKHIRLIALSISIISAIFLRLHVHQAGNILVNDSTSKNAVWSEYDQNSIQKSELLTQTSKLDFLQIEKILWRSKLDERNQLKVNSVTLKLLEQIHAVLPNPMAKEESERLSYLVKKSIPHAGGEQLANLINSYNLYAQHSPDVPASLSQINETQRASLLIQKGKDRVARQVQFFGPDLAKKLFNKKNITNEYLDQRILVNLDKSINNDEKIRRLDSLQNNYKSSISKEP